MNLLRMLPLRNLARRKGRTLLLTLLVAVMALCTCGGSLMMVSLSGGLQSLESRMGADVIVVPSSAKSKVNVDQILLNGTTGYFYMPLERYEQLTEIEGVEAISPQLFLCSLKADCCAAAVQIIGIDQATDFTVQPWISRRYSGSLTENEVVVGCEIGADVGESIRIYGKNYRVAARLETTGTGFDTAIYTTFAVIRAMMADAAELGINQKLTEDPEKVVSAVYIKVKDGYTAQQVADDINVHVRKVEAIQTRSMLTGIADNLSSLSSVTRRLVMMICLLCVVVLLAAFSMMTSERRDEFALLRMLGFSRKRLTGSVLRETLLVGLTGIVVGECLGVSAICLFTGLISDKLSLPMMIPDSAQTVLTVAVTGLVTMAACLLASGRSAYRLGRTDPGALMREDR